MKKLVLLFVAGLFISLSSNAQNKSYELGVRIGGYGGAGAAVDGTMLLNEKNRLHGDLGFYSNALSVSAFYDWMFPIEESFSFYPGVGAEIIIGDVFVLGVGGELGFEYAFEFPLTIGLDWRPTIRLIDDNGFGYDSFGLNIRYRF
jgi:hypothetical protein